MIRLMNMNVVFLAATVTVAFLNYHVKYDAQHKAQTLAKIERQITQEDEQIKILEAEWSHLNEPARLQALAERNLTLEPISAAQVVQLGDLERHFRAIEAKSENDIAPRHPFVTAAVGYRDDQ